MSLRPRPDGVTSCADPDHLTSTDGYCPRCKGPNGKASTGLSRMPNPTSDQTKES